jgi:hypothetical protein
MFFKQIICFDEKQASFFKNQSVLMEKQASWYLLVPNGYLFVQFWYNLVPFCTNALDREFIPNRDSRLDIWGLYHFVASLPVSPVPATFNAAGNLFLFF